jgi:DNA polymerase
MLYDDVLDTLAQLIRTAFVPKPGYKFCVADFSAIEARVLSHLAKQQWRIDTFKNDKDIYCESASQMFHVPAENHGVNSHLRQCGKIANLALGYGGSVGALTALGAIDYGLSEDELQPLVNRWRQANSNIVSMWWAVEDAVKEAIREHTATNTHGITFRYKSGILFIVLPSDRSLAYVKPRIGENKFDGESINYEGIGTNKR